MISSSTDRPESVEVISVAIGNWAVATAPARVRTLLGSCVGVVLYDRVARLGGLAHIVLPSARGTVEHLGKYADTQHEDQRTIDGRRPCLEQLRSAYSG